MSYGILIAGIGLVLFTLLDVFWSTLLIGGGGPLTRRVAHVLWQAALAIHRLRPSHRLLKTTGVVIVLVTIGLWIGLLWAGWSLIFNSDPSAIIHAQSQAQASLWERVYFTGFTVFTLGMGDFVAQGNGWQLLTAVAAGNGLFLVTLAITYLLPIVSAATEKRQLAGVISTLGETPSAIVQTAWEGDGFSHLESLLVDLSQKIALHSERHLAYPVLHFFHSTNPATSAAPALVAFDEALTLFQHGLAPGHRPPQILLKSARGAMTLLLDKLQEDFVRPRAVPPPPDLSALRQQGLPVVSDDAFREALAALDERRRLLHGYLASEGWAWKDAAEASTQALAT